jgi:hypothetical protein
MELISSVFTLVELILIFTVLTLESFVNFEIEILLTGVSRKNRHSVLRRCVKEGAL